MLPSCFGSSTNDGGDHSGGEARGATPFTIGSMPPHHKKNKRLYESSSSGIQKSVSATVTFESRHTTTTTGDGASDVELIDRGAGEREREGEGERDWAADMRSKGELDHHSG